MIEPLEWHILIKDHQFCQEYALDTSSCYFLLV